MNCTWEKLLTLQLKQSTKSILHHTLKTPFLINYAQREFGYTRPYSFAYERAFSDCFIYMYKSDICIGTPPQQQRERSTIHGLNQSRISLPLKNETRLQIVQLLYEHRRRHAVLLSAFHFALKKKGSLSIANWSKTGCISASSTSSSTSQTQSVTM